MINVAALHVLTTVTSRRRDAWVGACGSQAKLTTSTWAVYKWVFIESDLQELSVSLCRRNYRIDGAYAALKTCMTGGAPPSTGSLTPLLMQRLWTPCRRFILCCAPALPFQLCALR